MATVKQLGTQPYILLDPGIDAPLLWSSGLRLAPP